MLCFIGAICLAAAALQVSADTGDLTSVACEHNIAPVRCDQGQVIRVTLADYGRRDSTTCSAGRRQFEVRNTNCVLSVTDKVAQICNNQNSCNVRAENFEFGDPCGHTYKYLTISYTCVASSLVTSIICEKSTANLRCGQSKVIRVALAVYGRTDSTTCSAGRSQSEVRNTNCARSVTDKVAQFCDNSIGCKVRARSSLFGDPCGGTYKYLKISYTCVNRVANLRCGKGQVIRVNSAYYGRRDTTTCSSGRPRGDVRRTKCSRSATLQAASSCNGKNSCSIRASSSRFGDPCRGTYKYLKIGYVCNSESESQN
ncbi:hypothetical protein WMY93_006845 [Mugilogobius chulae]|uniref:SUEL-type lectin domain-containing protein n=1 Tax=Mugilogobius chulae TaxID=88201 RepID=A0AAW0PKU7_9GOBI